MAKLIDNMVVLAFFGMMAFVAFSLIYVIFTGFMSTPDTSFIAG